VGLEDRRRRRGWEGTSTLTVVIVNIVITTTRKQHLILHHVPADKLEHKTHGPTARHYGLMRDGKAHE
jgi:hypothetical protein